MNLRPIIALLVALELPALALAEPLRLSGSDLAAPAIVSVLQPASAWQIDLAGSKPGLDALRAGNADAAIVLLETIPANDTAIDYTPLAYRAPVVLVSANNPLAQIALPALAAVLGEGETENYRRWSELGLPGEWSARTVSVSVAAGDDPLLPDYLRLRILKAARLKTSIATAQATTAILSRLRQDDSAMAILPALPADMSGLRAVPVALNAGGIGFGPTPDNIHAGDYPMRMILAIATPRPRVPQASAALKALLSDGVAQSLAGHGFVPVPAGVRARFANSGTGP